VVIVDESDAGTDDVLVKLGLKYQPEFDPVKDLKDRFRSRIRVAPRIEVCPAAEVAAILYPAKSRKPVKFIDNRPKHV
jgi:phenylacetate-CoA ligase